MKRLIGILAICAFCCPAKAQHPPPMPGQDVTEAQVQDCGPDNDVFVRFTRLSHETASQLLKSLFKPDSAKRTEAIETLRSKICPAVQATQSKRESLNFFTACSTIVGTCRVSMGHGKALAFCDRGFKLSANLVIWLCPEATRS